MTGPEVVDIKESLMEMPTFATDIHTQIAASADYFRYATLGLAVRRVLSDGIPGSFAEVGVYQGVMSRFIHALAPDRKFYLFDTFAGFPEQDVEYDCMRGMFADTSIDLVLYTIGDTRNIIIRQGYVPETLAGLENETFAFVLLDLDLYKPIRDSLEFFYPRLSRGGYLITHDFNNPPDPTILVNRAVTEFMRDKPELIIEIADKWGSVMFRKL